MNIPVWEDRDWRPLPRLEGPVRADVCVIGLGGSGLAAMEELTALGVSAVGVEAGGVGEGAAGRNGGFVLAGLAKFFNETVAQLGEATASALYRHTVREIQRQAEELPDVIRLTGSLRIAADAAEQAECRKHLAALRYCGFPAEAYSGPEGEGLLMPTDGVMQPLRRVRAIARKLRQRDALLYENSPVRKIVPGSVVTDKGTIFCETVIVAVDGRLEQIFPELRPRVRTARLQMLATAPAPDAASAEQAGGYQPATPPMSGAATPGATVTFQPSASPDQAFPPPPALDHYPTCKRGQTDKCMEPGGGKK